MTTKPTDQRSILAQLRRHWAASALASLLLLLTGYRVLVVAWGAGHAARWALQSSLGLTYLLWVLWRNLPANHRQGERLLLPGLGAGNIMTLLRGALIACLIGFLFQPHPQGWLVWLPGALYTLAVLSDFLDGYLARVTDRATRLGEILDMSMDGWGVLAASLLAIQYGKVPFWYLVVALARYLFLAGLWLRRRLGLPVYELQPSVRRRAFAGVQMGFLFFILMPVFSPPGTHLAAAVFAVPFLGGFTLDWLAASGILGALTGKQFVGSLSSTKIKDIGMKWLPVGLRLLAVALLSWELLRMLTPGSDTHSLTGILHQESKFLLLAIIQVLVLLALSLGISGRIAAIVGLCILGVQQMFASLTPIQITLVILYTAILYLGTGLLSLWKPEERLVTIRAGERRREQA